VQRIAVLMWYIGTAGAGSIGIQSKIISKTTTTRKLLQRRLDNRSKITVRRGGNKVITKRQNLALLFRQRDSPKDVHRVVSDSRIRVHTPLGGVKIQVSSSRVHKASFNLLRV
jgi:hypothetical protein